MQVISEANESVIRILTKFQKPIGSRLMDYVMEEQTDEGTLLYNLLTKELLLLDDEEYGNRLSNEYLRDRWYMVPEGTKEKDLVDLVRWVLSNRQKKTKNITVYTIFPTTDCNARCFYCFEKGWSRSSMSLETAQQTADFVKEHCNGEKVNLCWFGGEPLVNQMAMEIICNALRENGNEFESLVISNGYLFDEVTVNKAVKEWNLNRVQITLDGTENIYNKAKAYIYREGNPYQIVLENIGHLMDAGVYVMIRLNMDLYNAEDLTKLVEELGERFDGRKGLFVYAYHLFKGNEPMALLHTEEEWEKRDQAMIRLEETIRRCGFAGMKGIGKSIKLNNCKADSGKAVTVMPDGNIGLCDHISDEVIGNVARKKLNLSIIESYKERITEILECSECFYYPECTKIKKCASESVCFEQIRNMHLRKIKRQMKNEYEKWKSQQASGETEDDENSC